MTDAARKFCVLLIDDETTLLDMLGLLLETKGYEVLKAQSVQEADNLWNLQKHRIDIIISDTWLSPGESAKDLLNRFKNELPHIPILVTSGSLTDENATPKWDRRIINYLPKPFDPAKLFEALHQLLRPI